MLDNDRIKAAAEKAARVAYTVLGLDCPYSVAFINDPDISEDARLDTQKNEVQLGKSQKKKVFHFSESCGRLVSEKMGHILFLDKKLSWIPE